MERTEAKRIVDASLPGMKAIMGLSDWNITMRYRKVKESKQKVLLMGQPLGSCYSQEDWDKKAVITLDPKEHSDTAGLLSTLWHELAHTMTFVYNHYMNKTYLQTIHTCIDTGILPSRKDIRAMREAITKADEGIALHVEKIAKNILFDKERQVTRCLHHGCSVEATTDICRVSTRIVEQVKARVE